MSYISKCSKEFWGWSKMQVLFQTMVAKVHDKVVRLVAAPVHLFGLAGGLIPFATSGWMYSWFKVICDSVTILVGEMVCSLADCTSCLGSYQTFAGWIKSSAMFCL